MLACVRLNRNRRRCCNIEGDVSRGSADSGVSETGRVDGNTTPFENSIFGTNGPEAYTGEVGRHGAVGGTSMRCRLRDKGDSG